MNEIEVGPPLKQTKRARHLCPRCKSGFIVFGGLTLLEATCLNCGHQLPEEQLSVADLLAGKTSE